MPHYLNCACGNEVTVEETAAGTGVPCRYGRTVAVPSLRELPRRSGRTEPAVAPELAVEAMLLAGKLPQRDHCVLCGVKTDTAVWCKTDCERARIQSGQPSAWTYVLAFPAFGWLGVLLARSTVKPDTEVGKDRIFDVP
jgi:hypothetical protein